jgi:hypothetical protein
VNTLCRILNRRAHANLFFTLDDQGRESKQRTLGSIILFLIIHLILELPRKAICKSILEVDVVVSHVQKL